MPINWKEGESGLDKKELVMGGIMKKTAVLIYDSFCNFEFSVALEILAMAEKEIVVFAK